MREPTRSGQQPGIDVPGAVLVTGGLFALGLGLSDAETQGWGSALSGGPLIVGAAPLVAFVLVQGRAEHPLLPLRVLADRDRVGAYVALLTSAAAAFGLLLLTRLGPDSSHLLDVLPSLLLVGLGMGLAVAPAVDLGTSRIDGADAGAASALVNRRSDGRTGPAMQRPFLSEVHWRCTGNATPSTLFPGE